MSTHAQRLAARSFTPRPAPLYELPAPARARAIDTLGRLLAEVHDVALCARHAHWNARGPDFLPLYDLLEDVGGRLDRQADKIATRIGALQGSAHDPCRALATESSMKPYPIAIAETQDHMEALALRLGLLSAEARLSMHETGNALDPSTAKVLSDVGAAIDDALCRVESHLAE